jgi:opacity protein-like surface antigen
MRRTTAMRHTRGLLVIVLGLACGVPAARAADLPEPIDLTSFGRIDSGRETALDPLVEPSDAVPVLPVVQGLESTSPKLYVSGIVGASFATVTTGGSTGFGDTPLQQSGSLNETIFTGGGAIGIAFARPSGLLRMEVEGRARGPMVGQTNLVSEGDALPLGTTATNGWSTLTNFWRDFFLTESMGLYAGGGFGVGGYRYAVTDAQGAGLSGDTNVTTFAWQVGTGVVYQISDRVTIDTGYRFFAMTPGATTLYVSGLAPLPSIGLGDFPSAFSASELLVSIRIYEPFRNWR